VGPKTSEPHAKTPVQSRKADWGLSFDASLGDIGLLCFKNVAARNGEAGGCGVVSRLTEAQITRVREAYDRVDAYQPVYGLESEFNDIKDARACLRRCELLEQHLGPDVRANRILDVGCALGYMAFYFAERGARVTAIDRDTNNVAFCRVLSKALNIPARFNLEALSPAFCDRLEEGSYDAVFIFSVLHHVLNEYGQDATRAMLSAVVTKSDRVYVELAQKAEMVEHKWRDRIPANDLDLLGGLGDVEKVGEFPGIDGITNRPLYCIARPVKRFRAFGRARSAPASVRLAIGLGQPGQAVALAFRALLSAPLEASSYRAFKIAWQGMLPAVRVAEQRTIRVYSPLECHSCTGAVILGEDNVPDRIECIPQRHKEGHCVFGIHHLVEENGYYTANFNLKITEIALDSLPGQPLVLLEAYENLALEAILADWEIRPCLLASRPRSFRLHFFAEEGQRLEFRIYWRGQCHLTVTSIALERRKVSSGACINSVLGSDAS